MADLIVNPMPADAVAVMTEQLNKINNQFEPFYHNLSNDERTGIRTMAEGREGLVRIVNKIAIANPDELRKKDDPMLLDNKLKYDEGLEGLRQILLSLLEKVEETQLSNSQDIMATADAFTAALQSSRGRNSALDQALQQVDEYNKKFGRSKQSTDEGAAADVTVTPVIPAT